MRFFILALLALASCSKQSIEHSDDYVLIEFASKLEEDTYKIEKQKPQ
jgi:hypothetical protein